MKLRAPPVENRNRKERRNLHSHKLFAPDARHGAHLGASCQRLHEVRKESRAGDDAPVARLDVKGMDA